MELERVKVQTSSSVDQTVMQDDSPRHDIDLDHYISIDPDPDLMLELDFIFSNQTRNASSCSKRTISDSWKSTDRIKSPPKTQKTRGRAIKQYESKPFLVVDALPLDRQQESSVGSTLSTQSYQKRPSSSAKVNRIGSASRSSSVTTNQIGSATQSPYSQTPTFPPKKVARKATSAPTHRGVPPRENLSRASGRHTPGSVLGYQSPTKGQRKVNHHTKSPFKHAVYKPSMTPEDTVTPPTTPAQELKERTALATYHMGKIMSREKSEHRKTPTGKLLKGKLKPLKPVAVEGPSISQCRGIVSDIRSYAASPSRTLSRRRQIIQSIPNVHEFLYERPQTVESIHRTSAASSVDENRDNMLKGDYPEIETDRTDKASIAGTEDTVPFVPPGSRATVSPATQVDITSHRSVKTEDGDHAMFITEFGGKNNKFESEQEMAFRINEKLKLNEGKNVMSNNLGDRDGEEHRPHTAHMDNKHAEAPSRPHTAGEASGKTKSVRFADDSKSRGKESSHSKAVKEMKNAQNVQEQKRTTPKMSEDDGQKAGMEDNKENMQKKSSSKVTCKPSDIEQTNQKRNDGNDKEPPPEGTGGDSGNINAGGVMVKTTNTTASNPDQKSLSESKSGTTGKQHANYTSSSLNMDEMSFKSKIGLSTGHILGSDSSMQVKGIECPMSPTQRSRSPSPFRPTQRPKSPVLSSCDRASRTKGLVPLLNVQSVIHGDGVHTVIGSESHRSRSRSPSPSHSLRSLSPQRTRKTIALDKNSTKEMNKMNKLVRPSSAGKSSERVRISPANKNNKLVRPSSANISGRDRKRYSKSSFTNSVLDKKSASEECLTSRKSKVYFEGENPPHNSLFVENRDDGDIKLKEDKILTFEEIEAELNAIKDDIIERRQFENAVELDIESTYSNNSSSVKYEDEMVDEVETVSSEYVEKETWRDYSDLLDVYRKKCMEVSEKCGAISEWLTSPRKLFHDLPKSSNSRQSSSLKKKKSSTSGICSDSSTVLGYTVYSSEQSMNGNKVMLQRTASETTISDSGCSMSNQSESTIKMEESCDIPKLKLHHVTQEDQIQNHVTSNEKKNGCAAKIADKVDQKLNFSTDICSQVYKMSDTYTGKVNGMDQSGTGVEDKRLLEIVCDELSEEKNEEMTKDRELFDDPLKVVATAKQMSKPKPVKKQKTKGPIAPFAPVCFEVNARPPKGYLYYFAYGTDMNPDRVFTFVKREVKRFWGLLFGFQLVFNKKGADLEAGGFANIDFNPFFSTEGCIYTITPEELELIDKHVGYPEHYEHLVLPVWLMNSPDPNEYGVAQYCVPALTYIAADKYIAKEDEKLNCDYSLSQCVKSSDLLTTSYIDHMITLNSPMREQVVSS